MHYALDKLERRQGKYTSSAQFLLYEEKVYFERKEVYIYIYIYIACLLKHWIYGYIYNFILRLGTNKRLIYYPKVKKKSNTIL